MAGTDIDEDSGDESNNEEYEPHEQVVDSNESNTGGEGVEDFIPAGI